MDYYLTLTKQMYLQQMLQREEEGEESGQRNIVSIVILSDNARSPPNPKSEAVESFPARTNHNKSPKRRSTSRRSRQFNQTLAKLEISRWQSILLSKAQSQNREQRREQEQENRNALRRARAAAPQLPRRRGSVECRPRYPRRQVSNVEQTLDGSNHSQVAANAA